MHLLLSKPIVVAGLCPWHKNIKIKKCQTNCSVQCTLAILPNIRISRSLRFPFMLISGRVIKPCTHS